MSRLTKNDDTKTDINRFDRFGIVLGHHFNAVQCINSFEKHRKTVNCKIYSFTAKSII